MTSPQRIDVELLLSQTGWVPAIARQLVHDAHLADDVTQATWAAALEHAPETNNPQRLRAWLYVVARNLARRMQKRETDRRHSEQHAARHEVSSGTDDEIDRVHRHKLLAEAVLALAEPYRSAIALRYFSELGYEDIATRQGITVGAARQRVSRGLVLLRERLDRDFDGDRRAWCIALGAWPRSGSEPSLVPRTGGLTGPGRVALLAAAAGVIVAGAWFVFGQAGESESVVPIAGGGALEPRRERDELAHDASAERRRPVDDRSATSGSAARRSAPPAAAPDRGLHGIVLAADGRPLAGATLVVRHDDARSYPIPEREGVKRSVEIARLISDADGRFACDVAAGRPHDLIVTHASGQLAIVSNRYAGERVVVQLEHPATLRGRVRRIEDGTSVAGVVVRGFSNDEALHPLFDGVTAADGTFHFANLPSARVGLQILPRDESCQPWLLVDLAGGLTTTLDVPVTRGQTLRGRVIDEETRLPIANAAVGLNQKFMRATTTTADGCYELRGLDFGYHYEVRVRADGYAESLDSPPVFARDGATVDFALRRERVVSGRVLGADGAPVADAYVAVVGRFKTRGGSRPPDSCSTRSDADGRFTVRGLRRGIRHSLFVRAEGFGSAAYELALEDLDERDIVVRDVVLSTAYVLEGGVFDEFGAPVAECSVNLRGVNADYARFAPAPDGPAGTGHVDRRRGRADDGGRFVFADLAPGTYTVVASHCGVTSETAVVIDERTAASLRVQLVLTTGLGIAGRVTDFRGRPVSGACVYMLGPEGKDALVRTESDGSFRQLGLAPGSYTVEVEPERFTGPEDAHELCFASVTDVKPGDANLAITLPRGVPITGRLFGRDGTPLPMARVEARDRDGRRVDFVYTRDDGSFELALATGEPVELFADGRGRAGMKSCARGVLAGASDLQITFPD